MFELSFAVFAGCIHVAYTDRSQVSGVWYLYARLPPSSACNVSACVSSQVHHIAHCQQIPSGVN